MLGNFLRGGKSAKPRQILPPLAPAIKSAITSAIGTRGIPTMPSGAQKAFQLAIDPNAEARDFIEVIESDEAISARVLKIANSVYFDRGHKSNTIEEAVNVIGMNELRCLLNASSLSEILPSKHAARSQLWSNDLATALISRHIGRLIIPAKAEIAFLGGLMHDIGKLLLLQRSPQEYTTVLRIIAEKGTDFCQAEEEVFVFNHTEVGQLVAEKWNFSEELCDIIRNHHKFPTEAKDDSILARIVRCADLTAHANGIGHPATFVKLRQKAEEALPEALASIGVSGVDAKGFRQEMNRMYDTEYDLYMGRS